MNGQRTPRVGDKVTSAVSTQTDWQGIVIEVADVAIGNLSTAVYWYGEGKVLACKPSSLRVTEAATYAPVYDFRPGQVWRDAGGASFFWTNETYGFTGANGELYGADHPVRPLTLVYDPDAAVIQ